MFIDEIILDGTKGATQGTYKVIGDDSLGDTWTAPDFDDSDWASGPLGFGDGASMVISEWPDKAAAKAFWDSPEYQEAKKLREGCAECQVLLIEADTING